MINVARYYHQETVRISDADDDVRNSVRAGPDITTAVALTAAADGVTTPDSTATTVMANATTVGGAVATATADSTAITVVVGNFYQDDAAAPTTTLSRKPSAASISTASMIAVAATTRRRRSTAQQGKKKTPRVQQLLKARAEVAKKHHGSGSCDSDGSSVSGTKDDPARSTRQKHVPPRDRGQSHKPAASTRHYRTEYIEESLFKVTDGQSTRLARQQPLWPLWRAASRATSLGKAGFIHRDISVNIH